MKLLTYRQAATRMRRSIETIKRWRRNGMPMGWAIQHGKRVRAVDEKVLLGLFRGRLAADPVHRARMRQDPAYVESRAPRAGS